MSADRGDGAAPPSETVDLVDDDDRVIGTVSRAEMRRDRLRHRAVFVAVLEPPSAAGRRRLLVHRRSMHKDIWPGRWDLAVGGVVAAGEHYDEAAQRETAEELGVQAHPVPVGGGRFTDADVDLVGRCYLLEHPGPFEFADGEVVEAVWVDSTGLESMLGDPSAWVPDSLALVLPIVAPLLD